MIKKLTVCLLALFLSTWSHAEESRTRIPIGDSPTLGPAEAVVTIIEFIDFQ